MSFPVVIRCRCDAFMNDCDDKTRPIIRRRLATLEDDPPSGRGGDKELIKAPNGRAGEKVYRIHISRHFTAFYTIIDKTVYFTEVMTIGQAHKNTVCSNHKTDESLSDRRRIFASVQRRLFSRREWEKRTR